MSNILKGLFVNKPSLNRRKHICEQLNSLGLDYWVFDAVDGRSLKDLDTKVYDPTKAIACVKRELTKNEIACAISHAKIWDFFSNSSFNEILILEDDALLSDSILSVLKKLDQFPKNWNMINLFSGQGEFKLINSSIENIQLKQFVDKMNGAVAYIINQEAVKLYLKHVYPIRRASDGLLGGLCKAGLTNCYGTEPQLASIDDELFPSLIGKR